MKLNSWQHSEGNKNKMASTLLFVVKSCKRGKNYFKIDSVPFRTLQKQHHLFKNLPIQADNNVKDSKFEVSNNSHEWNYVEQLLPFKTVPEPKSKSVYPSGWQPMKDISLSCPYFVERSKNHMLSVYLNTRNKGQYKITTIKKINGNIWKLHDELKAHITEKTGKNVLSYVHEGNNVIHLKGDLVYYVEQWLLYKGF